MEDHDQAMCDLVCEAIVANPYDAPYSARWTFYRPNAFLFSFGVVGTTWIVVWERADCFDSALETAMDCLAEVAPGMFTTIDLDETVRDLYGDRAWADLTNDEQNKAYEQATADLTVVGHTTYGPGMDAIPSWKWGVNELDPGTFPATWYALALRSQAEDEES